MSAKLKGVSCLAINKSRNHQSSLHEVDSGSTFSNDSGNASIVFLNIARQVAIQVAQCNSGKNVEHSRDRT